MIETNDFGTKIQNDETTTKMMIRTTLIRWIDEVSDQSSRLALYGLETFLLFVFIIAFRQLKILFLSKHGWSHRLAGALHFGWIIVGAIITTTTTIVSRRNFEENNKTDISDDNDLRMTWFWYDIVLGVLGTVATLTAARDFPHKYVSNRIGQSGTLHKTAIVTQAEMKEHAFYQFLNLWQAMYLHAIANCDEIISGVVAVIGGLEGGWNEVTTTNVNIFNTTMDGLYIRLGLLWIVTVPWFFRHRVPVHSFSKNWKLQHQSRKQQKQRQEQQQQQDQRNRRQNNQEEGEQEGEQIKQTETADVPAAEEENIIVVVEKRKREDVEIFLYRIKKAQYLFYKHVILHGVNISVVLGPVDVLFQSGNQSSSIQSSVLLPYSIKWRIFWLLLNTSYVMEFFLQTMVKRRTMKQSTMLWLQRLLMLSSSLGALVVLQHVHVPVCLLSIIMNFIHRHHDIQNTMGITILFLAIKMIKVQ